MSVNRNAPRSQTMICEQCSHEFTERRSDARFCSPQCRQTAYRRRKAEQGRLTRMERITQGKWGVSPTTAKRAAVAYSRIQELRQAGHEIDAAKLQGLLLRSARAAYEIARLDGEALFEALYFLRVKE